MVQIQRTEWVPEIAAARRPGMTGWWVGCVASGMTADGVV
jgi:hypothetical protein